MTSQPPTPKPSSDQGPVPPVDREEDTTGKTSTEREAYNILSDTIGGVNFRKSDNWFQLKVILICSLIGIPLGAIVGACLSDSGERLVGTLVGGLGLGFVGVVLGLFGSGIYLMIYRGARHLKGKHD
jgi:hypothetical protein